MKPQILFIRGIPDSQEVYVQAINERGLSKRSFLGGCNVDEYLESDLIEKYSIILDTNANSAIGFKKSTDLIFNQIAEADTNQKTLVKVDSLLKQIPLPCINHPKYVMQTSRELVSQNLQGIQNLIVPLTIRIAPLLPDQMIESIEVSGLEFPVIIRTSGVHGGVSTYLVKNVDEVRHSICFGSGWAWLLFDSVF